MALGLAVANDIASAALTYFVRGKGLSQTMQSRPLLSWLKSGQKAFGGGKDKVSEPVQGAYMSDTAGFLTGYSEDDTLTFAQAANLLRAEFSWKEVHAGLIITWTELKKDGITVTDNQKTSKHSEAELTQLTSILQNRLDDFGESYARTNNTMLWADGTADAKKVPGITALLTDTPTLGTTGGLSRVTYGWWRHRTLIGAAKITPSPTSQTLCKTLRKELRQLTRYGGKPNKALCGSLFIEALEAEIEKKGSYTQDGFLKSGSTDLGMGKVRMTGLGEFEYDPTLDDMGYESRCYVMDSRRITLRPMQGEDNKVITPERPYNYFVFLKSMTWTGALQCTQLNSCGIYEVDAIGA